MGGLAAIFAPLCGNLCHLRNPLRAGSGSRLSRARFPHRHAENRPDGLAVNGSRRRCLIQSFDHEASLTYAHPRQGFFSSGSADFGVLST